MGTDTEPGPDPAARPPTHHRWWIGALLGACGLVGAWLWLAPSDPSPGSPTPTRDGRQASAAAPTNPQPAGASSATTGTASPADPALAEGLARVTGQVRLPAGSAPGAVDVVVAGSGVWPPRRLTTGPDGRFQLDLPAGVYELRASRAELVAAPLEGLDLNAGEQRALTLELHPGMTLRGVVLRAETGAPIPNAAVQVAEDSLGMTSHALRTDADGRFQLRGLRAMPHRVSVEAPGYVSLVGQERSPGPEEQRLLLRRAASLDGQVVDDDGAPLADVVLEVRGETEFGEPLSLSGESLGFQAELFERARKGPLDLGGGGQLGVTLGPVPKVPLLGPLPDAQDNKGGGAPESDARFRTDARGHFHIPGLPAGTVRLVAQKPGYAVTESDELALRSGQPLDGVRVVLERGGSIVGQVGDARGFPVPLVRVELNSPRERLPRSTLAANDGSFRFDAVLGRCTVTATAVGLPPVTARAQVSAGATAEVQLTLPAEALTLRGRVFDHDHQPVENALIRLRTSGPRPVELAHPTEADGAFEVPGLPAPPYELIVEHTGHAAYHARGVDDAAVEVVLAQGFGVRGEVRDSLADAPLAGVRVELASTALGPTPLTRTTRSLGRFEFVDLPVGNYELSFSHAKYASELRTVQLDSSVREALDVDPVELTPAGELRGEVVDRFGSPVYGAEVSHGEPPDWSRAVRTDHDGRFALSGVPAGTVWLHARVQGEQVRSDAAVEVRAGEVSEGELLRLAGVAPEAADDPEPSAAEAEDGATTEAGAGAAPEQRGAARGRMEEGVALSLGWRDQGAVVTAVGPGSRAAAAGVRVGDRLQSVDGEPVLAAAQGRAMLRGPPGTSLRLELLRGRKVVTVRVACERYAALP